MVYSLSFPGKIFKFKFSPNYTTSEIFPRYDSLNIKKKILLIFPHFFSFLHLLFDTLTLMDSTRKIVCPRDEPILVVTIEPIILDPSVREMFSNLFLHSGFVAQHEKYSVYCTIVHVLYSNQ